MIISRTPFRISFFGGGTDYPDWYLINGGSVLSTTFDKYTYITCRFLPPFFEHKHRIAYSVVENVINTSEIQHPAVREILTEFGFESGLEIHADADLPARSGLGSSSSFVVGLLNALYALKGEQKTKQFLAHEAIRIEREVLGETVGSQDQTAAAHGGFNVVEFQENGSINVNPLVLPPLKKNQLNDHLMLFFTGFSRIASEIAKSQVANFANNQEHLVEIYKNVGEAVDILTTNRDIREFGELLNMAWASKRALSKNVSTSEIDEIYGRAKIAGAIGGKILGAGGGGFMLLFVEPSKQDLVRKALGNLVYVPFKFESHGTQIIYYQQ